jgi:membrane protein YqaA with SNARE-associated domain
MLQKHKFLSVLIFIGVIAITLTASWYLTAYVLHDVGSQEFIQDFGYFGIFIISLVAGLNILVPVPAASFVPVFTAGGISLFSIIALLVAGTMAANFISYATGKFGSKIATSHYPKLQKKLNTLYTKNQTLLPYFVFGFAAFIPVPDEVYLVPLGIIGVHFTKIIIPLFIGTVLYQTLAAFGVTNIFKLFLS